MRLYTSYYANSRNLDLGKCVGISIGRPVPIPVIEELVPSPYVYSSKGDELEYTKRYLRQLYSLDVNEILMKIYSITGDNSILLCYEGQGKFCHRHIVSRWITYNSGVIVTEI